MQYVGVAFWSQLCWHGNRSAYVPADQYTAWPAAAAAGECSGEDWWRLQPASSSTAAEAQAAAGEAGREMLLTDGQTDRHVDSHPVHQCSLTWACPYRGVLSCGGGGHGVGGGGVQGQRGGGAVV